MVESIALCLTALSSITNSSLVSQSVSSFFKNSTNNISENLSASEINDLNLASNSDDEIIYTTPNSYLNTLDNNLNWKIKENIQFSEAGDLNQPRSICLDSHYAPYNLSMFDEISKSKNINYGCGSVAMVGILSYLSESFNYNEIISNPDSSEEQKELILDVLENTNTIYLGNNNYYTSPSDYVSSFNYLMEKYRLSSVLDAKYSLSIAGALGGYYNLLFEIKESLKAGLPATLGVSAISSSQSYGAFSSHYSNIIGVETWIGCDKNGNVVREETLLRGLINKGYVNPCYCDASVLKSNFITLITYERKYNVDMKIMASDFKEEFVNSSGGGQYFFHEIEQEVNTTKGDTFRTKRLRCSYIEDKYLVLSSNRKRAGKAYLEIEIPFYNIEEITFDMSLWSEKENINGEYFDIDVYRKEDGVYDWCHYKSYNVFGFSTNKSDMKQYKIVFPKNTYNKFRFMSEHYFPAGSRNKGRIVLENISIKFNV